MKTTIETRWVVKRHFEDLKRTLYLVLPESFVFLPEDATHFETPMAASCAVQENEKAVEVKLTTITTIEVKE